jgi:WD40 repeat protein
MTEHREALVVGINRYPLMKDENRKPQHLEKPATDAEAVAQLLEKYGNFRVQRLPELYSPEGTRGIDRNPHPQNLVTVPILEAAIAQLFNPSGKSIPDTALLFFAGHGLRKEQGEVTEGFLATSDVNPDKGKWGVSLRWLRELLQKSPVRQQIIWLDCCHSGELLNILDQANPGKDSKALDRCLIAACREFEVSREQLQGEHGILTAALLQGLEPDRDVDGFVTNYKLADFINKEMSAESQRPIFQNSGNAIILTDKMLGRQRQVDANLVGKCPYKALEYFTQEDAVFFYGRTALTDELIDKIRTQNFIAVLGASGSGKSSVLRAGLLDQLKRGQKLSRSDRWKYYDPFTPGEHPLASLKNAIGKEAQELRQFIQTSPSDLQDLRIRPPSPLPPPSPPTLGGRRGGTGVQSPPNLGDLGGEKDLCVHGSLSKGDLGGSPDLTTSPTVETERVVLVIDQFEECFTMCQDSQEREEFFKYLLETLEQAKHKLCLVLGMRADFLGKCVEYAQLAQKIDQHLVMVKPMSRQEIEEAITKPAELVDLQVEKALVTKMTEDVVESPGSLPLLQYTLTELWNKAQESPNRNRLTLECYHQLGGIEKTLPKQANEVYASLKDEEKPVAKRIFLELTQLGETSDTRRRVYKEDLVNPQHSEELLDRTIEQLVKSKLIVTTHESLSQNAKPGVILDIVHEALIRHWQELRQWVAENQVALEIERKIEARAKDWERNGKTEDLGLLLQGATLIEAETYLKSYGNLGLLDGIAQEYIQLSQIVRDRLIQEELERKQRELKAVQTRNRILVGSLGVVSAIAAGAFFLWRDSEQQKTIARLGEGAAVATNLLSLTPLDRLNALMLAIQATSESQSLLKSVLPQIQSSLYEAIDVVRERNILKGHQGEVCSVAFSPDGKTIVSGSADNTIRLWDTTGKPIGQPLQGHQGEVCSVAFSPDGKTIVSGSRDKTIRLWDTTGKPIGQPLKGHQGEVCSVAFSPDGKTIVSGSTDNTIRLWDTTGKLLGQPLQGHQAEVYSVAFSPDGKTIVSGSSDKTIRLWDTTGKPIGQPLQGHQAEVYSVAFSPDGKTIVSGSRDNTIRLWDTTGKPIGQPLKGYQHWVISVAFSPDGKTIVSGSRDNTIRLWDTTGKLLGQPLQGHQDFVISVAFSPDGKTIVSGSADNTIRLWDTTGKPIGQPLQGHQAEVYSVAFSPDGKTIVSGSSDKTIRLWDTTGKPIGQPLQGHQGDVRSVAFSPDGKTIVSGSRDKTIRLWDTTGKPIGQPLQGHQAEVYSVAFSPDGKTIVSGSIDNTIRLWDTTGKPIGQPLQGHQAEVYSVAFSPDGKTIVSGSRDKTIRLWDTTGKPIGQPLQGHQGEVCSVAFSPDGKTIVSGSTDNTIRLWDTTGKPIGQPLKGHQVQVCSVAFSPDGKTIVSGSFDNTIRLWDTTGKPIGQPLKGHQDFVISVAFSPDGKTIVSGSSDKTIRLWDTWPGWLEVACDRLIDHPILVDPKTTLAEDSEMIEVAKGAGETCQKLAWNPAQKAHFLVNKGRVIGQD